MSLQLNCALYIVMIPLRKSISELIIAELPTQFFYFSNTVHYFQTQKVIIEEIRNAFTKLIYTDYYLQHTHSIALLL